MRQSISPTAILRSSISNVPSSGSVNLNETPSVFQSDLLSNPSSNFPSHSPSIPEPPTTTVTRTNPTTTATTSTSDNSVSTSDSSDISVKGDIPDIDVPDVIDAEESNSSNSESIGIASAGALILGLFGFIVYQRKRDINQQVN